MDVQKFHAISNLSVRRLQVSSKDLVGVPIHRIKIQIINLRLFCCWASDEPQMVNNLLWHVKRYATLQFQANA